MTVSYREFSYSLAAGEAVTLDRAGTFVACLSATSTFDVAFDDGARTSFRQGLRLTPDAAFRRLRITAPADRDLDVAVGIGQGDVRDGSLSLVGGVRTTPVGASGLRTGVVTVGPGARVVVADAATDRSGLIVSNLGLAHVFLGDAMVSNNKGLPLASAHSTIPLPVAADLWAYNPSNGIVTLATMELVL